MTIVLWAGDNDAASLSIAIGTTEIVLATYYKDVIGYEVFIGSRTDGNRIHAGISTKERAMHLAETWLIQNAGKKLYR